MTSKTIVGIKKEMTQIFSEDGKVIPVTLVQLPEGTKELKVGDRLKITGTSKGKGFAGVMKRWGFAGGPATHGSGWKRKPGSIGGTTTPGRVYKGKKMPGRMGGRQVTVKGFEVMALDAKNNLVSISGALPGPRNNNLRLVIESSSESPEKEK